MAHCNCRQMVGFHRILANIGVVSLPVFVQAHMGAPTQEYFGRFGNWTRNSLAEQQSSINQSTSAASSWVANQSWGLYLVCWGICGVITLNEN